MPGQGERRTVGSETREWNGSRWEPVATAKPSTVDNPKSFGALDMVPGLQDVLNLPSNLVKGVQAIPDVVRGAIHQPSATLKGFVGGASEAATPSRVGLLSLLTGGATVPAALAAAGGESLAQAGRVATNAPNAATSFPEAARNVVEAGAVPAVAGAIGAVPGVVSKLGGSRKVGGQILGGGVGAYEGYKRGGPLGALEGGIAGALGGGFVGGGGLSRTMRALQMVSGLGGDEAAAAAAPEALTAVKVTSAPRPIIEPTINGVQLPQGATARNVEATNLRDAEGFSHTMAGKLAGIPGAGQIKVTRVPMGDYAITDEMIRNAGGTVTPPPEPAGLESYAPKFPETVADPRDPSVTMRGLERAILPESWTQLPDDAQMAEAIAKRNATGTWGKP